ncbi:MAG: molecular chaperone HscC [Zoogloeaceae bacterium]|jgi:molecular chaperone HscC|nr:molecular chaperone HscC [Zoogloeaceae bacterium]
MIIGIDLGTTNSLVGVWQNERATLIPNALGAFLTPSVVSVDENENILIGEAAKERLITHPGQTAAAFKRYMGSDRPVCLGKHRFRPEELSALILKNLKNDAETWLHEPVTEAIITVPAYFNDTQRKATRAAGQLAGLKVERLLNEPTAAALAFGIHNQQGTDARFAVLDLGGGTFDVSVLDFFEGVMEVRASAGDNFLGGEDFIDLLAAIFMEEAAPNAWKTEKIPAALQSRVRGAAEKLLHKLSDAPTAEVEITWEQQTVRWQYDNERFALRAQPLLERLRAPIARALRDSRFKLRELDELLLVGGATRIAIVRQAMTRLFGRFPNTRVHPDQAIALGAVTQAALKARDAALEDMVLTDICPYSLGVAVSQSLTASRREDVFCPVIERNTLIPCSREHIFSTVQDYQDCVNLEIYQGESRSLANNIKLGEIKMPLPPRKAGEISLYTRFTYDIDGLLEIDVLVPETNERKNLIIQGGQQHYDAAELEKRRAFLATLKIHPRDQAENQALLAKAERIYEENLGITRDYVSQCISSFKAALESQDEHRVARARKELEERLARVHSGVFE